MTDPEPSRPAPPTTPDGEPTELDMDIAVAAGTGQEAAAGGPAGPGSPGESEDVGDALTSNDYSVAFSPRQVAVGLAIVAGLIALVAARRRGRSRRDA